MDKPPDRVFFPELESLRGMAALSVVLMHILVLAGQPGLQIGPPGSGFFDFCRAHGVGLALYVYVLESLFNGRSAVLLFFVLSGFVMGVNVRTGNKLGLAVYVPFMIRRVFRLLPVIPVAIVVGIVASNLSPFQSSWPKDLGALVHSLLLLDVSLDGPLWTLRVEIAASVVYLFMLYYVRCTSRLFQAVGLLALSYLNAHVSLFSYGDNVPIGPTLLDSYFYCFYLGLVVPSLGKALIEILPAWFRHLLLLISLVAYGTWGNFRDYPGAWHLAVPTLSAFYVIIWVLYGSPAAAKAFLNHRVVRYLGRISYSLYALHLPILMTIYATLVTALGAPYNSPIQIAMFLVALPLCIGAAHLCELFIERPSIRLGRRFAGLSFWRSADDAAMDAVALTPHEHPSR